MNIEACRDYSEEHRMPHFQGEDIEGISWVMTASRYITPRFFRVDTAQTTYTKPTVQQWRVCTQWN
jgi:hypothetical protein